MHGTGNDFIVVDCISRSLPDHPGFAVRFCRRRFGIGADQVLLLCPSESSDFRMEILNADGSSVEMCGNGIRCLARYIWDRNLSRKEVLSIETPAGIIRPARQGNLVRVDMGEPVFEPEKIPVSIQREEKVFVHGEPDLPVTDYPIVIEDREFRATFISMGNPHAVIFISDHLPSFPVGYYGPIIERHPMFPKRINVEFVDAADPDGLRMRVWERGSGETLACGTGASATGVAAMVKGLAPRNVTVHVQGGVLSIEWSEDNHVYMTGPAEEVFTGSVAY